MSITLPTPAEAMRQAIERAQLGDYEHARFWLDVAIELRRGARPRLAPCSPEPCQPIGCDNGYHIAGCWYAEADDPVEHLAQPPAPAGEPAAQRIDRTFAEAGADETAIMRRVPADPGDATAVVELPMCAHCGHALTWVTPGAEATRTGRMPHWSHAVTGQEVCPVNDPTRAHTYATPRVDERG